MRTRFSQCLAGAAMLAVCGTAGAQYYGGIRFSPDPGHETVVPSRFFVTSTALDDGRVRYGLRLGYRLDPTFSLESHYSLLDPKESTLAPTRRYGFDLTSRVKLWDRIGLVGSAGIARLHGDAGPSANGGMLPSSYLGSLVSRTATVGRVGVGMSYQVTDSLGLRLDVERYRALGGGNIGAFATDNVSFGVSLRF
ncbi:MAG TPA: outer membrane beta-barrel protein [Usitatibacteraceae bacterium]|nr:outer membrane beta-barrel protein [Usitatibacteraceae bacterium]